MDKHDRIQQLHQIFKSRRYAVPTSELTAEMECGEKTVRRHVQNLNDYHHTNYVYSRKYKGWVNQQGADENIELPGLWLTANELQSLALLLQLVNDLGRGVLNTELGVIKQQIHQQLKTRAIDVEVLAQRITFLPLGNRQVNHKPFGAITQSLLDKNRLQIDYLNYQRQPSQRQISPQGLVYYRENWYVDAWCHLRSDLRTFSVARIQSAKNLAQSAKRVSEKRLKQHFASGYGIFAGQPTETATLHFLPDVAHEVASQQWHPKQKGQWQGQNYVLQFPYADERELIQDILRYTPSVIVQAPASLKQSLKRKLQAGLDLCNQKLSYPDKF